MAVGVVVDGKTLIKAVKLTTCKIIMHACSVCTVFLAPEIFVTGDFVLF